MPDERTIQRILDYLGQYGHAFGAQELRSQLVAAGYAAADIDTAFARWQQPTLGETINVQSSTAQNNPEAELDRMISYLRENQHQYSLDALGRQLIASGRSPELVAVAMTRLRSPPSVARHRRWPFVLLLTLINLLLTPALSYVLALLLGDVSYTLLIFLIIAGLECVVGVILLFKANTRWVGTSLLLSLLLALGIAVALALIAIVLLAGACIVFLQQFTGR